MFSKSVLVSRRLLALELGDLVKARGISEFRLRDTRNWPGDDLQNRTFRWTWFNKHEAASQTPEEPVHRLDETMYAPKRWRERKYQATWREAITEEEAQKLEAVEQPSHQNREKVSNAVPQRQAGRLQRVAIPTDEFLTKFKSDQRKRRMRHYEAGVMADRLSNEEYPMV